MPQTDSPVRHYGWSKLANLLCMRALNTRVPAIAAFAVHPGGVQGKLLRFAP